jgi:hypothetical protein
MNTVAFKNNNQYHFKKYIYVYTWQWSAVLPEAP